MTIRESERAILVVDVELEPLVVFDAESTLREVSRALDAGGLGTVLIENASLVECTERDIARAIGRGADPDAPVGSLPLDPPPFVRTSTSIADALSLMSSNGRRGVLVVSRDGRALGFLAATVAFAAVRVGAPWLGALKTVLHIEDARL